MRALSPGREGEGERDRGREMGRETEREMEREMERWMERRRAALDLQDGKRGSPLPFTQYKDTAHLHAYFKQVHGVRIRAHFKQVHGIRIHAHFKQVHGGGGQTSA